MEKEFLLMAGEYMATMPAAFSSEKWSHTMTVKRLVYENQCVHREGRNESLKGIIFFGDIDDKNLAKEIYDVAINYKIPCWPSANILKNMLDRHKIYQECLDNGFVNHPGLVMSYDDFAAKCMSAPKEFAPWSWGWPVVVKTGFDHRGEGKFLANNLDEMPIWHGEATIEPFFEGYSVRVLLIDDDVFTIQFDNQGNWIKNQNGAEVSEWDIKSDPNSVGIIEHAKKVRDHFGLEIAGIDYIVQSGKKWGEDAFLFLEINQFPGLGFPDKATKCATNFIRQKMSFVEELSCRFEIPGVGLDIRR